MVVGLTGQTGAGKSMISTLLRKLNSVRVIDCDQIAKKVAVGECLIRLAIELSPTILAEDGTLNRRRLGSIVFSDRQKKQQMEQIIYPYILGEIERELEDFRNSSDILAVLDAPTLFEAGADKLCDVTVCVTADSMVRLARIVERDKISVEEATARMLSQTSEQDLCARCDHVIENSKSLEEAQRSALMLFSSLLHKATSQS